MNLSKNLNDAVKAILDHCGYTCEDVSWISIENRSNCQWEIDNTNDDFTAINLFENGNLVGQFAYYDIDDDVFKGEYYTLIQSSPYCDSEYNGLYMLLNKNQIID